MPTIGNILRHEYDRVAPDLLWKLAKDDLPVLREVCIAELVTALGRNMDRKIWDVVLVQVPIALAFGFAWLLSLALPQSLLKVGSLILGAAFACSGLSIIPLFQWARLRIIKRRFSR